MTPSHELNGAALKDSLDPATYLLGNLHEVQPSNFWT
jgi:hypothetical protein